MKKFEVSIIIPAYNEEEYIRPCLQSLVWQNTKRNFEVILIDNNSTDATKKIAMSFKDKLDIRIITEKKQGRGIARWRGFEEATGEFLFSSDADTIFPPEWIERFMEYFKDKKIVAVTSLCDIDGTSRRKKIIFKFVQLLANEGHRIALGHYWLSGFSYAIRKDVYIKAGKIDKSLNALDDIDLGRRVQKFGKIQFVRNTPVLSSNRRYKNGVSSGLLAYVKPAIQVALLKKNKFTMDNPR
ncbi:MAG: glycosyltransferase family 2 protein [bacterium]|nr:glycosyltransferase family 2 protein [bacterium]